MRCEILIFGVSLTLAGGCSAPECATPDYRNAECRVQRENQLARLDTPAGVDVEFVDPAASSPLTWDALGVLSQARTGEVQGRVATLGNFAMRVSSQDAQAVQILLNNVDPAAKVTWRAGGQTTSIAGGSGLSRGWTLELPGSGEAAEIRGELPCPSAFRLAVLGDIQTNPAEFSRILDRLAAERADGEKQGSPLLGLLLLGDLSEFAREDELRHIADLLANSPVPVATTPGNHDVYAAQAALYNQTFGPGNYAFTLCNTKVVLLDSGSGQLAPSVEARLPELLRRGDAKHLLLGTHYPAYAGFTGDGWTREDQAARLLVEAAIARVDLVLAGHVHALVHTAGIPIGDQNLTQVIAGTGGASQGAGTPRYGYLRLTIDNFVKMCFVEVSPVGGASQGGVPGIPSCDS